MGPAGLALLAVSSGLIGASSPLQRVEDLAAEIPAAVGGYKRVFQKVYDATSVFEYLNGGAEVYLTYTFRELLACRYEHPREPEILLDVFDMGSSEEAYGVFSQEQESGGIGVGQGSEYTPGLLRFWKNRFFVSVTATRLTDAATEAVLELGRNCADAIVGEGSKPAILSLLPKEGLVERGIRFLHSDMVLRQHADLGIDELFLPEKETQAVLAEYRRPGGLSQVLVAIFPDERAAIDAENVFLREREAPDQRREVDSEACGEFWCAFRRLGPLIVITLKSPGREEAAELAESILLRWKEEQP